MAYGSFPCARTENYLGSTDKNRWLARHLAVPLLRVPADEGLHRSVHELLYYYFKSKEESFRNGWVLSRHVAITTSRKIDEKCPSHSNIEGLCATPSSPFSLPPNFLLPIFRAARANPDHPLLPEGPKTLSIRSTLQQPPPTVDTTSRSST